MTKQKALYPYTLQPVALNMTDSEFNQAQLALFNQTKQTQNLTKLKTKEWGILGAVTLVGILGIVFVSGYSTIIFWLLLACVLIYLVLRTIGLNWYIQKEYEKQLAGATMPNEMKSIKLGIQPHGLVMTLPNANTTQNTVRGMTMRGTAVQQAVIPWTSVTSWDETDEFVFIMFEIQSQQGSQIIPKRLHGNGFSINTIKEHLTKITPKGLKMVKTLSD